MNLSHQNIGHGGQTLAGQSRGLISARNQQDWFEYDCEGQRFEEITMEINFPRPIIIPPGSGKVLEFMGVTHKLMQPQTGGAFYLFEAEFEPETGNSLHVHHHEDEIVYVLEGTIQISLDNQKLQAGAGGAAHLPKNIPHALYNPMKTRLKFIALTIPGGMEDFFEELSAANDTGTLTNITHKEISRKYGIEWLET
jgi:mannose-6-phosphate isomerase-like protein (cupin superfamily)